MSADTPTDDDDPAPRIRFAPGPESYFDSVDQTSNGARARAGQEPQRVSARIASTPGTGVGPSPSPNVGSPMPDAGPPHIAASPIPTLAPLGDGEVGALIIGSSNAGKTMLLLAIDQASRQPAEGDDFELEFRPEGETAQLGSQIVNVMRRGKDLSDPSLAALSDIERQRHMEDRSRLRATDETREYPFELVTTYRSGPLGLPDRRLARMVMSDGPGGALFPEAVGRAVASRDAVTRWREHLLASADRASALVLCVDACRPQSDLVREHMPGLLAAMSKRLPDPGPRDADWFTRTILGLRRLAPSRSGKLLEARLLTFERVLLLFTKIDTYCAEALSAHEQNGNPAIASLATPLDAAHALDPLRLARERLGSPVLHMIHQSLRPGAQFGAGISSAAGFDAHGNPFFTHDGGLDAASAASSEDLLKEWRPFGVRNALYFLITGRESETVMLVTAADLKAPEPA